MSPSVAANWAYARRPEHFPRMTAAELRASAEKLSISADNIDLLVGWPSLAASLRGSVAQIETELARRAGKRSHRD